METTMPCDKGLENSVLGTLILYPEVYKDIRDFIIEDDVFYQKKAKLLWRKLKTMIGRKDFIDNCLYIYKVLSTNHCFLSLLN